MLPSAGFSSVAPLLPAPFCTRASFQAEIIALPTAVVPNWMMRLSSELDSDRPRDHLGALSVDLDALRTDSEEPSSDSDALRHRLRPPCHELVALPFDSGALWGDSRPPRTILAGRSNRLEGAQA